jgi:hypothetical protein
VTPEGEKHAERLQSCASEIRRQINEFTLKTFRCRGGRLGSGMGTLLEALWGFYSRETLSSNSPGEYDIAWIVDNAYNDFALLQGGAEWDSKTGVGEYLRIEAKSMNLGADETKGHFDALAKEIDEDDLLLVLVWRWNQVDSASALVYPQVVGEFLGPALEIAALRDALHLVRGGSFLAAGGCPDCEELDCQHVGEPLNARGVRERRQGPPSATGPNTSYAANFGGLVRMLKARSPEARAVAQEQKKFPVRAEYLEFVDTFEERLNA